jgi:hypothetical protein
VAGTDAGGVIGCVSTVDVALVSTDITGVPAHAIKRIHMSMAAASPAATTVQNADAVSSMYRDGEAYASSSSLRGECWS